METVAPEYLVAMTALWVFIALATPALLIFLSYQAIRYVRRRRRRYRRAHELALMAELDAMYENPTLDNPRRRAA